VLDETVVDGMATALPFHRAVVRDPAFTGEPFTVHTRWIETEWANPVAPFAADPSTVDSGGAVRETVVVEVGGKRLEVSLPGGWGMSRSSSAAPKPAPRRGGGQRAAAAGGDTLASPMQGTIVKIAVADGDTVAEGDLVVVLEAMKMEQPLNAHKAGVVEGLTAAVGDVLAAGAAICRIT
jgi:acetyl-CoA/propionyl-CoA carboxylase biotin carboxyl carrier protein